MKLLNTIATAVVISTSLFAAPAVAETKMSQGPTYEELESNNYQLTTEQQNRIWASSGWKLPEPSALGTFEAKLFECKKDKCMYFVRNKDQTKVKDKDILPHQVDCKSKQSRYKWPGKSWSEWSNIFVDGKPEEGLDKVLNEFCRL